MYSQKTNRTKCRFRKAHQMKLNNTRKILALVEILLLSLINAPYAGKLPHLALSFKNEHAHKMSNYMLAEETHFLSCSNRKKVQWQRKKKERRVQQEQGLSPWMIQSPEPATSLRCSGSRFYCSVYSRGVFAPLT